MRTIPVASPHSAITSTNGTRALGCVSANKPERNLVTVLNAACIAIGVMIPKPARLVPKVRIRLWPVRKMT
jgi:hypothetical protein